MKTARTLCLAGLVFGALRMWGASTDGDANVVVDFTDEGRRIVHPTKDRPVFYVPIVMGYREEGGSVAGLPPPPEQNAVLQHFAKALADQGYRVAGAKGGEPTLLLVFAWGAWNPRTEEVQIEAPPTADGSAPDGSTDTQKVTTSTNSNDMVGLVAGNTVKNLPLMPSFMTDLDREALKSDVSESRYFAIVAAFDWAAAKQHQRVMLWTAKMSVRSIGAWLADALPGLIASGSPFFGRETLERQTVTIPLLRQGEVKLGELEIKGAVDEKDVPPQKPAEPNKKP